MPLWLEVFAATGPWAGAILALLFYLHSQSSTARIQLEDRINVRLTEMTVKTEREHSAVRVQVADLSRSMSENYVQVREFTSAIHSVNESITETRKDIGSMSNRLDQTLRDFSFPRRGED